MTKIQNRNADKSYEIYLALYQAITGPLEAQKIYKQFSREFFDLIVVDECHRGSAEEDSAWREILEYFSNVTQIGMTAFRHQKQNTGILRQHYSERRQRGNSKTYRHGRTTGQKPGSSADVFADVITDRAAAVIFAHNHPSGDLQPSDEDIRTQDRLVQAAKILGIRVLDHLIVSRKGYFSLRNQV